MARPIDPNRDVFEREILDQAARVFAEKGYRNATTEDIAERVKLKKSSLYHYFDSKENLLHQALAMNLRRSLAPLQALGSQATPPRERLRQAILQQADQIVNAPYVAVLFLTERASLTPEHLRECLDLRRQHEQVLRDIVDAGVADGSFAPVASDVAVKLIYGALNGLPWWWQPGGRDSLAETAGQFADLLVERMLARPVATRSSGRTRPAAALAR
ncbi:MAG: TetR/AcrR family transcriptional regulator [Burkholderiales bacterium]